MDLPLTLNGLADTNRLGRLLSGLFQAGISFTLNGPLGAGKSELARAMVRAGCGETGDIPSPTFTLVQTYETASSIPVWHMDLYRLNSLEEVLELGIEEAFYEAVCLIEWPDRLDGFLPPQCIDIKIDFDNDDNTKRRVSISAEASLMKMLQDLDGDGLLTQSL